LKCSIYPGCLISYRFPEYEKSTKLILQKIGVELIDIDSFSCCGSQVFESLDEMKINILNTRNLAIAQKAGINVLITLCGSCTYMLKRTLIKLQDELTLNIINKELLKINLQFYANKSIKVMHIAEFLNIKEIFNKFKNEIIKRIELKVAIQNPCMVLRPKRISNLEMKDRLLISTLLKECGLEIVSYKYTNRCCGGTMLAFKDSIAKELGKMRYAELQRCNIDLLILGCPNCEMMYSVYQNLLTSNCIPAIFFTQILGIAIGFTFDDVNFDRNMNDDEIYDLLNKAIKNIV